VPPFRVGPWPNGRLAAGPLHDRGPLPSLLSARVRSPSPSLRALAQLAAARRHRSSCSSSLRSPLSALSSAAAKQLQHPPAPVGSAPLSFLCQFFFTAALLEITLRTLFRPWMMVIVIKCKRIACLVFIEMRNHFKGRMKMKSIVLMNRYKNQSIIPHTCFKYTLLIYEWLQRITTSCSH
jgi:hypothetical protein